VAPSVTLTVDIANQKEPQVMKNVTKTIKRTNTAFKKIAFEGSPLGTIADLIQHTYDRQNQGLSYRIFVICRERIPCWT
jgi:hypothetical protein